MSSLLGWGMMACAVFLTSPGFAQSSSDSLVGLWYAKLRFGPDVRGRLVLDRIHGEWRAAIAGRTTAVRTRGDSLAFEVPGDGGAFVGRMRSGTVAGRWVAPSRASTPVVLTTCGVSCYNGDVVLDDDAFTFYLKVSRLGDGTLSAFLRNPERNLGGQGFPVNAIRRDGEPVALLDRNGKLIASG